MVANRTVTEGNFTDRERHQKAPHVCAICEDGGDLWYCDGPCRRHFHSDRDSRGAERFSCTGISMTMLRDGRWKCPDCMIGQAKCWGCPLIGTLKGVDGGPPLLRKCPDALCIRFFYFECLPPEAEACSLHTCERCKEPESNVNSMVHCLRCPTAWHYACLKKEQKDNYCPHRPIYDHTWEGETRYMFYCEKHVLHLHLGTSVRDHLSDVFL